MHTCSGTSNGTSLSECLYATRSINGMITFRPGSMTSWNLPSRSTTHAFCCGTTRIPSMMNAMTKAAIAIGMAAGRVASQAKAATDMTSATISFASMWVSLVPTCSEAGDGPAAARWRAANIVRRTSSRPGGFCGVAMDSARGCYGSGSAAFGDAEQIPLDALNVEHLTHVAVKLTLDDGVPQRVAVFHAREATVAIHPRFERHGVADVEGLHAGRPHGLPPRSNPEHTTDRNRTGDYDLDEKSASEVSGHRSD